MVYYTCDCRFVWFGVSVLLLYACSTTSDKYDSTLDRDGNPNWVSQGSQSVKTSDSRLFHGVGRAVMRGDLSVQITVADKRAKAELAKLLSSYMEILSRNFIASSVAKNSEFNHQEAANHISVVTRNNMPAVNIVGHWRDKKSNYVYSIAELNLVQVKSSLKPGLMNAGFVSYFGLEGNKVFDNIATLKSN